MRLLCVFCKMHSALGSWRSVSLGHRQLIYRLRTARQRDTTENHAPETDVRTFCATPSSSMVRNFQRRIAHVFCIHYMYVYYMLAVCCCWELLTSLLGRIVEQRRAVVCCASSCRCHDEGCAHKMCHFRLTNGWNGVHARALACVLFVCQFVSPVRWLHAT